jgi:isocitrate dehydrogenase
MALANIDCSPEVRAFAMAPEGVIIKNSELGKMTKGLAALVGKEQGYETNDDFLASLAENLKARLG